MGIRPWCLRLSLLAIALTTPCRSCCGASSPWAVFVVLVQLGLQAELNGIALSVAGPSSRCSRWRLALAGRGSHRVPRSCAWCCSSPSAPGAVAHLPWLRASRTWRWPCSRRRLRPARRAPGTHARHRGARGCRRAQPRGQARRRVEAERVSVAREVHDIGPFAVGREHPGRCCRARSIAGDGAARPSRRGAPHRQVPSRRFAP